MLKTSGDGQPYLRPGHPNEFQVHILKIRSLHQTTILRKFLYYLKKRQKESSPDTLLLISFYRESGFKTFGRLRE